MICLLWLMKLRRNIHRRKSPNLRLHQRRSQTKLTPTLILKDLRWISVRLFPCFVKRVTDFSLLFLLTAIDRRRLQSHQNHPKHHQQLPLDRRSRARMSLTMTAIDSSMSSYSWFLLNITNDMVQVTNEVFVSSFPSPSSLYIGSIFPSSTASTNDCKGLNKQLLEKQCTAESFA